MPVTLTSLIQACRNAFHAGDYSLVLQLTSVLMRAAPLRAEPWRVRAEALVALGETEKAVEAYSIAVERTPGDAPLLVRQGRALARCGRYMEALAAHEAAFAAQPSLLSALHDILTYRLVCPDDPALEVVRVMATEMPSNPGARSFACYLLGRIYSQAGRDDEAFAFYSTANALSHSAMIREPEPRGPGEFRGWWAPRLSRGQALVLGAVSGDERCPALLIAGLPRSGKSLVEHLLTSHPALASGGELGGLYDAVEACSGEPEQRLEQLQRLTHHGESSLVHHYRQALTACGKPQAKLIVDTSPANLWDLGYMGALHPDVPLILCRRNILDLGAAIFFKRFRSGHAYSYDQAELGAMLALADQAMAAWQAYLPNPILIVDYETLVANPAKERVRLLLTLGLDPSHGHPGVLPPRELRFPLHPSHSHETIGAIVKDLCGFGQRFAMQLGPMLAAYSEGTTAMASSSHDRGLAKVRGE